MATTWIIDAAHSDVLFKVKHLVISTVTGRFDKFEGSVVADSDDFSNAQISFSADIDSINTNNAQRDGHLKSDDFFNAAAYPKLTFTSTSFTKKGDDEYQLIGELSLRGVTKSVTLQAELGGITKDPYGNTKAGFSLKGKINRKDFGLSWSALTETGGLVVSDDVQLVLEIQLLKQAQA